MQNPPDVQLSQLQIVSHAGKNSPDISSALVSLKYYESILELSVKAIVVYADTGARNTPDSRGTSEEKDANLQFAEKVYIHVRDSDENKLSFINDDKSLIFIAPPIILSNNQKEIVTITLGSKEYLENLRLDRRVNQTYEGKISDIVTNILKNHLKTNKQLDIESTLNKLKIIAKIDDSAIPFNSILSLCPKAVPELKSALGKTSGYFFFETSEGYKFKSIDKLLQQKSKRTFIANDTVTTSARYDGKILNYIFDGGISYTDHLVRGTYNSALLVYDPVKQTHIGSTINSDQQKDAAILASSTFAKIPENLNHPTFFTAETEDKGYVPHGGTIEEQAKKSKEVNFDVQKIFNQSRMRFNQLFAVQVTITIYGDISLHAGDTIECYFPEISYTKTQVTSFKKSGKYLIADLCHYITPNGPTYTKLGLVRDSFGKKLT
jgi:hypothetical protein